MPHLSQGGDSVKRMNPAGSMVKRSPPAKVGFGDGFVALFEGVGFVFRPRNWLYSAVPALVALTLAGVLGSLAIWGGAALGNHLAPAAEVWSGQVLHWVLKILFVALALALAVLVAVSLAQPISGFALDTLSRRQERDLGGIDRPGFGGVENFFRTLKVTLVGLALALLIIAPLSVASLSGVLAIVAVPLKLYVAALCVVWDFLDYPLGLRGVNVRDRLRWVRTHFAAVTGMAVASGLVLMTPGLGLLLLPAGVAGATRLVVRSEQDAPAV